MSTTLTHTGLPVGVTRFLLRLFEQVARPGFGCPPPPWRWCGTTSSNDGCRLLKGRICAVWTQACRFAEALGITPRSINSAERT
jgi:hypothetical protein